MRSYSHFGTGFEVWNSQQSWFWIVVDPRGKGGSIGAALTEADAVREASLSIEETSRRREAAASPERVASRSAWMPPFRRSASITHTANCWEGWLTNLTQYLAGFNRAT